MQSTEQSFELLEYYVERKRHMVFKHEGCYHLLGKPTLDFSSGKPVHGFEIVASFDYMPTQRLILVALLGGTGDWLKADWDVCLEQALKRAADKAQEGLQRILDRIESNFPCGRCGHPMGEHRLASGEVYPCYNADLAPFEECQCGGYERKNC